MTQEWKRPGDEPPGDGKQEAAASEPADPGSTSSESSEVTAEGTPAEPAPSPAEDPATSEPVSTGVSETPAASAAPEEVTAAQAASAESTADSESAPEASDELPAEATETPGAEELQPVAVAVAPAAAPRRSGAPWLLVVAAALIPAALVGVIVFLATGSSGTADTNNAAGIVDGLIRLGPSGQTSTTSYKDELPPEFSADFPIYDGADVVVSIAIAGQGGTSYFIILSSDDSASDVFAYYMEALDTEPWQVEVGRASDEFTGLRFFRPDNINISGDITLHQSDLDGRTAVYLSYDDLSQAITPGLDRPQFVLGTTKPLPPGFPSNVPIYGADSGTVVRDTYFERGQGGQAFIVTFLTPDSQDDVIDFYTEEFRDRGR
jgi:hypothetical protein